MDDSEAREGAGAPGPRALRLAVPRPAAQRIAGVDGVAERGSTMPTPLTPEANAGGPVIISMPRPDLLPVLEDPVQRVPGVRGAAVETADGEVSCVGDVDRAFAARSAYFLELAQHLGSELGLEGLRAFQISGPTTRIVSILREGGGATHVLAGRAADYSEIVRAVESHQGQVR